MHADRSDLAARPQLTVPGLLNRGDNLCYLNSALQVLATSAGVLAAVQGSRGRRRQAVPPAPLARTQRPPLLTTLADLLQSLQPCTGEQAALSSAAVADALRSVPLWSCYSLPFPRRYSHRLPNMCLCPRKGSARSSGDVLLHVRILSNLSRAFACAKSHATY